MHKLVVQTVIRQWDKSQLSAADSQTRRALADRYPVNVPPAVALFDGEIILDQHGDDVMGNRIRYQLTDARQFLIDRCCFSLPTQTLTIKQPPEGQPVQLSMADGWVQCHYQWRYKVFEGGFYYWLYEAVTLNACFIQRPAEDIFLQTEPIRQFTLFLQNQQNPA